MSVILAVSVDFFTQLLQISFTLVSSSHVSCFPLSHDDRCFTCGKVIGNKYVAPAFV